MPKLVLVRHGESVWNVDPKRFAGRANIPLTDKGRDQAKKAGRDIGHIDFHIAFTSTLIRAQETLVQVVQNMSEPKTPIFLKDNSRYQPQPPSELPVYALSGLDEGYCGAYEGLEVENVFPNWIGPNGKTWYKDFDLVMPEGETFKEVYDRVSQVFQEKILTSQNLNKNILVVGHGLALVAVVMFLENMSPEQLETIDFPNAEPRIYDIDTAGKVSFEFQG